MIYIYTLYSCIYIWIYEYLLQRSTVHFPSQRTCRQVVFTECPRTDPSAKSQDKGSFWASLVYLWACNRFPNVSTCFGPIAQGWPPCNSSGINPRVASNKSPGQRWAVSFGALVEPPGALWRTGSHARVELFADVPGQKRIMWCWIIFWYFLLTPKVPKERRFV